MSEAVGLDTFVGRVRGTLTPDESGWVEASSAALVALQADLIAASDRLRAIERRLGPDGMIAAGAAVVSVGPVNTWEQVVAWAAGVNAALVEVVGRRGLPRSFDAAATGAIAAEQAIAGVSDRTVELGWLLQRVRGEQIVDELLTSGVLAGPPAATGRLSFEEHGAWDIEFLGAGGVTLARADVTLTADPGEILEHLASRPGVDVVYTTTDAADGLVGVPGVTVVRPDDVWPSDASTPLVVDLGAGSAILHAELHRVLDAAGVGDAADALYEAVPLMALLVVGARATRRAATGTEIGADIASGAWQQTKDVVTTAGVSELVGWASGMNLLKVPTTVTFALSRAAVRDARTSVALSGRRVARARRLMAGAHPGRPDPEPADL